jgi:phage terminase large subunit-like protein
MTPPLVTGPPGGCPCGCALTPATSYGFDVIDFARNVLLTPFDPWQELGAIHIGELLPDGRPRFRQILVLVARQNGKSLLAKTLALYWMFIEEIPYTLYTSTNRIYAKKAYTQITKLALNNEYLSPMCPPDAIRKTIGEESFHNRADAALSFAANNGQAGRSDTVRRWICDEVREHRNRDCYDAVDGAMNAVDEAQTLFISNQGDDEAIILDELRNPAIEFIETGAGDPRIGLLEWSSPDGANADDLVALGMANPNMNRTGHGPSSDVLLAKGIRAQRAGGTQLSGFTTEVMCRRVNLLNPAIEPTLWDAAGKHPAIDLALHRDKVALCLDVSLSGDRADLIAAADIDGIIHLDVVRAWSGPYCTQELRRELPDVVAQVAPRAIGWFPDGPAAVVAADLLANKRAGTRWPPRRVKLVPLTTEAPTAAMSFAELVKVGEVHHTNDPALNAQVGNAQRLPVGQRWTFGRRGAGPVSGCYAAAGATWLARTLPPPPPPLSSA